MDIFHFPSANSTSYVESLPAWKMSFHSSCKLVVLTRNSLFLSIWECLYSVFLVKDNLSGCKILLIFFPLDMLPHCFLGTIVSDEKSPVNFCWSAPFFLFPLSRFFSLSLGFGALTMMSSSNSDSFLCSFFLKLYFFFWGGGCCFPNTVVHNAATATMIQVPAFNSFEIIPRRGIAASYGNSNFNVLRNHCSIFRRGCTISRPSQQHITTSPLPHDHLSFSVH